MRIAVHAFDGITSFHLSVPLVVFGEVARQGWADWSVSVWNEHSTSIRTSEGLNVGGLSHADVVDAADMVVFPSWPAAGDPPSAALVDRIRSAHARGATIVGLCLGATPVAASGILDGRSATTHWEGVAELAATCPRVQVRADALYLDHGDVLTAAGTASGLDACLHLVRSRLGSEAASNVARRLVIAPHREGHQAQYIPRPVAEPGDGIIGETISWALAHLDCELSVRALAARALMSPRTFSRRFSAFTGDTPARWVSARRLDEARRLLEVTTWPVSRVASACGFASPVTFRQSFIARYGTTPRSYRQRFGGVLSTLAANPHERL